MSTIRWEGRAIYKDGYPYVIRAVNYANVPIGSSTGEWTEQPAQLALDLQDIKDAGFNTIKVYVNQTFDVAEYDSAMALCDSIGLDVLALVFVTQGADISPDSDLGQFNRTALITRFTTMINRMKDYPATIGYGFGNEVNISQFPGNVKGDWYSLLNEACVAGKAIDSTKFTFTANAEITDFLTYEPVIPNLDVLGVNMYRGTSFGTMYTQIKSCTRKPVLVTEYGTTRLNTTTLLEQEALQATTIVAQTTELENNWPTVAGYALFQWTDGWAKAGNPSVHDLNREEWWGITEATADGNNTSRTKKQAYTDLQTLLP